MKKIDFARFIERYLEGNMQKAEKDWFEAELKGNPSLQKELNLRRKVNRHMENQDSIAFRKKLMNAEAVHRKKSSVSRRQGQFVRYAAAVAVLALLGSITVMVTRNQPAGTINEIDMNVQTWSETRSYSNDIEDAFQKAKEYFNDGEYAEAIKWFNKVVNPDMEVEYLNGVSHMKIELYNDAIGSFRQVVDDDDNLFIEDAKFYLAYCYLKTDQKTMARPLLEEIKESDSYRKKDARKLLRKAR